MPRGCRTSWLICCAGILAYALATPAGAQPEPAAGGVDPYVEPSPLLYEPKTPEEMFSAVLLMVDLARMDLANRYLQQFIAANPDDETLIRLRDKHGTGDFVMLSRIKSLKSKAQGLLERLGAVSRQQSEDPTYADQLIAKLESDAVQRELAIRELRNLGEAAVPHMLRKLVNPSSATQSDQIIHALGRIGRPAIAPALAGLDAPQPSVRLAVLSGLALINGKEAVAYLWHPAFAESESPELRTAARKTLSRVLTGSAKIPERLTVDLASQELRRITRSLYFQQHHFPLEDDGNVLLWVWDDAEGTAVRKLLPPEQAQLFLTSRFARQSLDLSPENPEAQRLSLGSQMGWSVAVQGRDHLLSLAPGTPGFVAMTAGEQTVTDVLVEALSAGQLGTAQAALQILGEIGSHQQIFGERGRKSPVLAALNFPDLRVQFAAANAILRTEPTRAFRGADRVVSILNRAINNSETNKALVIDADTGRAEITAGYLSDLGYTPVMVRTGQEGFAMASTTAGIDLAVIHVNCVRWDLSQTVANLRADARTAYLPLVLYGPEDLTDVQNAFGRRDAMAFPEAASSIWNGTLPPGGRKDPIQATTRGKLARLILRNGPALFVAESGSASDFVDQVRPFASNVKGAQLSGEERGNYQSAAVRWLAHLSQAELGHIYDLSSTEESLSDLIENPEYALTALTALSGIKTNTIQGRLLQVAVNAQEAADVRAGAARNLAFHMQRHGVMLTEDQAREIHDAWNAEAEPVVATALASVVGSLSPDSKTVGSRIGTLPAPR